MKWALPLVLTIATLGCQENAVYLRNTQNPRPVTRVVSLSPGTTELAELFLMVALVGRTASDNYPGMVRQVPIVMNGTKPDFEDIAHSGANAVLYDPLLTSQEDVDKLKQMGLILIPIGGNTLDDYITSLYKAGSACSAETTVNDYIETQVDKELAGEKSALLGTHFKVAMIMPGNGGSDMILGTKSFQADILRQIGATPVGPDSNEFVTVNSEELIKDNPDVILVAGDPNQIVKEPQFANLTAVKKLHIYGLNQDIALRQGARVDQLIEDMGSAIERAK